MEKHNQKKKKKDLNGMANIRNATKSQKEKKNCCGNYTLKNLFLKAMQLWIPWLSRESRAKHKICVCYYFS